MGKLIKTISEISVISPIVLVDIGARWGLQRPWDRFPSEYLDYTGFDADKDECKRLNDKCKLTNAKRRYLPYAISDDVAEETLHLTKEEGCSSFYKPNHKCLKRYYYSDNWQIKKEIRLQTTPLRDVFDKERISPDFMKIDTQGFELKILKGTGKYLDDLLGMEIEVEFIPMYEGQPLFSEVESFVRGKDFEIYDLNRYWGNRAVMGKEYLNRGQLIFGDAIFFRSADSLYKKYSGQELKVKLLKIVMILSLYGFFDAAIEYIDHDSSPFDKKEQSAMIKALREECRIPRWQRFLSDNKYANKIGLLFKITGNLLCYRVNAYGWGTDYNAYDGRYAYFRKNDEKKKKAK